jgi:hypothetical protein
MMHRLAVCWGIPKNIHIINRLQLSCNLKTVLNGSLSVPLQINSHKTLCKSKSKNPSTTMINMLTKVTIRYVMKYAYSNILNLFYTSFSEYLQWKQRLIYKHIHKESGTLIIHSGYQITALWQNKLQELT